MVVPYPWDYTEFVNKMQSNLGEGDRVYAVAIEGIKDCHSSSLNEILDAAVTYSCQEQGFREITLSGIPEPRWDQIELDDYLLQRMIE